ncbi:thiol-dependent ubiquitin-specific protease [Fragilaria crotonensis]|nr:thiol-dependent ubiquitin-specific protease [Fragilaria crotonensis]
MTDATANMSDDNDGEGEDIFHWPPLESDPSIFTQYLHNIGLSDEWEIGECYGLDEDCLGFIPSSCVAMIVNAERLNKTLERAKGDEAMGLRADFYMKQSNTLDNACGIIACLHAIFNNLQTVSVIEPNSVLANFWNQVKNQTPQERCQTLESSNEFKRVHKSYAMQGQSHLASSQEDVNHHYTAFVVLTTPGYDNNNSTRRLVEFDGTKRGPLVVADNVESLVHATAAELQRRLQEGEISESLSVMTLVKRY